MKETIVVPPELLKHLQEFDMDRGKFKQGGPYGVIKLFLTEAGADITKPMKLKIVDGNTYIEFDLDALYDTSDAD